MLFHQLITEGSNLCHIINVTNSEYVNLIKSGNIIQWEKIQLILNNSGFRSAD